jgi:trigger factor
MLQEIEEIGPTTRRLKINIPSDVIQAELDSSYNRLRATVKVPGFRPGRVPHAILKKRFGREVEAEVLRKIVPEYYSKAIEEARIEPVGYPEIDEDIHITPSQPLTFTVTVEIKPEIGEIRYEGIEIEKRTVSIGEEDVDRAIRLIQENRALYSVTEDEVGEGDMAIIDCEAFIDGQPREEFSYKEYPFIIGSEAMPSEFTEALKGRKKGETVEVRVAIDKSHQNQELAGKEMVCRVMIKETKKRNLPPLDDNFAKELDAKDMEDLRRKIRDDLEKRAQKRINLDYKRQILNKLIKDHDFSVPDSMVEAELQSLIIDAKQKAMQNRMPVKSDEELRQEYLLTAKENVKGVLLLEAIGKKENIEVTDEEVRKAMEEMGVRNGLKAEDVMKIYMMQEGSLEAFRRRLFADKVLDLLVQKAVISEAREKEDKG